MQTGRAGRTTTSRYPSDWHSRPDPKRTPVAGDDHVRTGCPPGFSSPGRDKPAGRVVLAARSPLAQALGKRYESLSRLTVRTNLDCAARGDGDTPVRAVRAEPAPRCRNLGANAEVQPFSFAKDDERRCAAGFCLAILNGVASPAGAPWRSRRRLAGQSSRPVLACIIGALRPWIAPMISSEEIPSR
jgi:hypothetical protein